MSIPILPVLIENEYDVVAARQRARDIAVLAGFDTQDQTRIATAVSEIARNAFQYARGGKVEFSIDGDPPAQSLTVRISDSGPGIRALNTILLGQYKSRTGMGMGITGARRLMDEFSIESSGAAGTVVILRKNLPAAAALTPEAVSKLVKDLGRHKPEDLLDHLRQQNQELMRTLDELRRRHEEVRRLNLELEETNRGVVALHAELEDRAERLRHADAMKSRFLSHMSHEFRTPLNSILALCKLLLTGADGPLTAEQMKQINYIRTSGQNLFEMVNDLLDLAKIEAGRVDVRPSEFTVENFFGTLRGIFKPLAQNEAVALVFEEPRGIPPLCTDESKLAQILRNFISNALKFTERGEVRVSASLAEGGGVAFSVRDTGIGIAPEHHARIFEEFSQVESPVQRKVKGTGLGLPLAKALSELLGGGVSVESAPGEGSTFTATIPLHYEMSEAEAPREQPAPPPTLQDLPRVLIVDDEEVARYVMRRALARFHCTVEEAADVTSGLSLVARHRPDMVLLDLRMPGRDGFDMLRALRDGEETRAIPVVVVTSKTLSPDERAFLERNTAAVLSKEVLSQERAFEKLAGVLRAAGISAPSR